MASRINRGTGMARNWDSSERAIRERDRQLRETEADPGDVLQQEGGPNWPLLIALLGGLVVALLANTFVGLLPD
ncbi:hypothetical protein CYD53_101568 [Bosea psychrotolerans]|uniref:Uncharacterized protein n=2 Tax=Bosea psychrotolerans TaxID=1871628 RepID=A0A2S4MQM3_9HYPH|nr:hypothetical protein CYD53_101568 [Bosea psychrotolerans]